jgi:hypothetical protein
MLKQLVKVRFNRRHQLLVAVGNVEAFGFKPETADQKWAVVWEDGNTSFWSKRSEANREAIEGAALKDSSNFDIQENAMPSSAGFFVKMESAWVEVESEPVFIPKKQVKENSEFVPDTQGIETENSEFVPDQNDASQADSEDEADEDEARVIEAVDLPA